MKAEEREPWPGFHQPCFFFVVRLDIIIIIIKVDLHLAMMGKLRDWTWDRWRDFLYSDCADETQRSFITYDM